ncbi:MAG: 2-oxoacid:acceptor oxidoreductase family protein [Deltaproteobacteria bacterium]|nr:2-oxoacid:acceptor oxidoreductase family protein [Deltaproteobacteria bacterium]MBW2072639.1 2-oxoacid:acceptor oxidoreductase family protein [Deltaproteobacteria bacterium]
MESTRIVLSGSGGQGVITAAIILAEAAVVYEGLNAVQTQSYGPEARGGATRADVVISREPIHYPKVINPHILVCLTQESYDKFSDIVRPGGLLLIDRHFVKQEHKVDARQVILPMYDAVMEKIGKPIVFNICVLGTLIGLTNLVRAQSIMTLLEEKLPAEFLEMNRRALEAGLHLANGSK